jgi:two-component system OmpR family sensor kinase
MRGPGHRLRAVLGRASLLVRVMVAAGVLVMVTSVVMGSLGVTLLRGYLFSRVDAQLKAFSTISRHGDRPPAAARRARAARSAQQLPTDFLLEIVSASGRVRVAPGSLHGIAPPKIPVSRLHGTSGPFTAAAAGDPGHSWRVQVRPLAHGQHGVTAISLDNVQSTVSSLETVDAVAGGIAILLLAAIGLPLIRVSLAPLTRIEDTAAAIAAGDLSRRIAHPRERTEVGRLAVALNAMLGRIEAAYRAREEGEAHARDSEDHMRRFVADASHELRTPLTSVKGLAELYMQQEANISRADVTRLVSGIQREADRMGLLVDDLLLLAELDQGRPLDLQPVDLASLTAEAVQGGRTRHPGRRVSMGAGPDPVIVLADATRLRQVIDNLINNALQHTSANTPVTVTVAADGDRGVLTVADTGPGMNADQAAHVFERFYRSDRARSRARGGTGLGLPIAAAIVTAHHGTISVETQPAQGAAFRVRLPLAVGDGFDHLSMVQDPRVLAPGN